VPLPTGRPAAIRPAAPLQALTSPSAVTTAVEPAASAPARSANAIDLVERAMSAYEHRRFQEAIALLSSARAFEPADPEIQRVLAASYRSLGWGQIETGRYEEAVATFRRDPGVSGGDGLMQTGLGYAHVQLRQDDQAVAPLLRAVELEPGDVRAYLLLGELHDRRNDLSQAAVFFQKALTMSPGDAVIQARVQRLRREQVQQGSFVRAVTRHFTVQFDGNENRDLHRTVIETLEEAYGEVGRALSFYPDDEVSVVLYTAKQFQDITRLPGWAGASYDGKIRVPSAGYEQRPDVLKKILYHEYVHAVIHAITRQQLGGITDLPSPRVPFWLHEGLAQYLESGSERGAVDDRLRPLARRQAMIPLTVLEGSFMGLNAAQASLAYAESLSVVGYLVDRHGMYRVTRFLEALSRHQGIEPACREAFSLSYDALQTSWQSSLVERHQ
jgi:Flp pilus assembly protein TadD